MKNYNSDYIKKQVDKTLDELYLALPKDLFNETATRKITNVDLVIRYENPLAYGFPERCFWEETYSIDLDIEKINKLKEKENGESN